MARAATNGAAPAGAMTLAALTEADKAFIEGIEFPADYPFATNDWDTLRAVVFPDENIPTALVLHALKYCAKRNLDVMRRPLAIVKRGQKWVIQGTMIEARTTATRTLQYAGKDACVMGPDVVTPYEMTEWDNGSKKKVAITIKHPEWAQCTVYRLVGSPQMRVAFTSERIYWEERAQTDYGGCPTYAWRKQPYTMLTKCAEAAAIRHGFPEELAGLPVEGEADIEGITIDGEVIDNDKPAKVTNGTGKANLDKLDAKAETVSPPPPPPPPAQPFRFILNTGEGTDAEDLGSVYEKAPAWMAAYWSNAKLLKDGPNPRARLDALKRIMADNANEYRRASDACVAAGGTEEQGARSVADKFARLLAKIEEDAANG